MLGHMLVPASCKSGSSRFLGFGSSVLVYRNRASLMFMSGNCWLFLYVLLFIFFFNVLSFLAVSLLLKFC
jgi:hypothetical protein